MLRISISDTCLRRWTAQKPHRPASFLRIKALHVFVVPLFHIDGKCSSPISALESHSHAPKTMLFGFWQGHRRATQGVPSPIEWRDQWVYFLMVDRFNNSVAGPRHQPLDDPNFFGGANFSGIQDQLRPI